MFEIEITKNFSAAHQLKHYKGDCSKLHGHNWQVKVIVQAKKLDEIGIALDFRKLKKTLDEVVSSLDHSNLNELPQFNNVNPTSEVLAKFIYREISNIINDDNLKVSRVSISESTDSTASYYE
ncbi:MAG TPA: 6-carboxytetrahydropterin synthase QueD [Victivallales bacterium]|mgnify:CR=1 FL=1|nr:6-carboxytetrahydropterin synthase QueD [Victivallales bacterium]HPO91195.1 6-carboxytetrahydropterin synthase QueD [Victivallales bacterium]HRR06582.1 6-carboxytetrahydropterin synthase QueD [Victivallales bacterium]HRR28358.1 6-carboxytetrahydropterin synthase QueD [Victivallales bacterium]